MIRNWLGQGLGVQRIFPIIGVNALAVRTSLGEKTFHVFPNESEDIGFS
jgi:hypothetical protein